MTYRHIERKSAPVHRKQKSGRRFVLGFLFLLICVAVGVSFANSPKKEAVSQISLKYVTSVARSAKASTNKKLPTELYHDFYEQQRYIQETVRGFRSSIGFVVRGDHAGETLLRFFDKNHVPAVSNKVGGVSTIDARLTSQSFFVIRLPATPDFGIYASFNGFKRLLKIVDVPITIPWQGFIGIHEMIHVYDIITDRESPLTDGPNSDEFIKGEVRAHEFEIRIIDRWTGGRFGRIVDNLAPSFASRAIGEFREGDFNELDALFPPTASHIERGARNALYLTAIAFRIAEIAGVSDVQMLKVRQYRVLLAVASR